VLGLGGLAFYGLGLGRELGAVDRQVAWPQYVKVGFLVLSVVDQHQSDSDPDPACFLIADPDPNADPDPVPDPGS
jgi:hypothetical protein